MTLLAITLAIVIDYFSELHKGQRHLPWFSGWGLWVEARCADQNARNAMWAVLAILAVPTGLTAVVQQLLSGQWYGLMVLLFSVLVLLLCLGPLDLFASATAYQSALEDADTAAQAQHAHALTGDAGAGALEVSRSLFWHAEEQLFATVFWFVVLGPFGAVWYRLSVELATTPVFAENTRLVAQRLRAILDWIPTRLLALGYALAGHFDQGFERLFAPAAVDETNWDVRNRQLLIAVGEAALSAGSVDMLAQHPVQIIAAARSLLLRALGIAAAVLALLTLAGWFG